MKKRCIAFIHHEYPFGGGESVTTILADYLMSQNFRIVLFAAQFNKENISSQPSPDMDFTTLPDKEFDSSKNAQFVVEQIQEKAIDILVFPVTIIRIIEEVKRKAACKTIFMLHNLPFWETICKIGRAQEMSKQSFMKKLEWHMLRRPRYKLYPKSIEQKEEKKYRRIYNSVDAFGALCEEYKELIDRKLKLSPAHNKVVVLKNPVITGKKTILEKQKTIIYVGRLSFFDKRLDRLIRIWSNIHSDFPDWKFRVIGEGHARNNYERLAQELQCSNLYFEGYTNDPTPYYQDAALLCLSSTVEGWPMVLSEAQMAGVVCIAFNSAAGIHAQLAPSGKNGWLVNPFDLKEYEQGLRKLMSDEHLRKQIQESALKSVKQYDIEHIGKQWIQLFDKLVSPVL